MNTQKQGRDDKGRFLPTTSPEEAKIAALETENGALREELQHVNLKQDNRKEDLEAAKIELDGVKKALDIAATEIANLKLSVLSDRFMWFPVALVAGLIGWFLGRIV